jgi:hypothetical protein
MWTFLPKDIIELLCCSYFQGKDAVSFLKSTKMFYKYLNDPSFLDKIKRRWIMQLTKECDMCAEIICDACTWNYSYFQNAEFLFCLGCCNYVAHETKEDHLKECSPLQPYAVWKEPECKNIAFTKRGLKHHKFQYKMVCPHQGDERILEMHKKHIRDRRKDRTRNFAFTALGWAIGFSFVYVFVKLANSNF